MQDNTIRYMRTNIIASVAARPTVNYCVDLKAGAHKIFMQEFSMSMPEERSSQDLQERTCCPWSERTRSWHHKLPRASRKGFHTGTSKTWNLQELHTRTSEARFHQDLHKVFSRTCTGLFQTSSHLVLVQRDLHTIFNQARTPKGILRQDLLTRACTRSRKDLLERISPRSPQNFSRGQPFCANWRSQIAHGHDMSGGSFCGKSFRKKCRAPGLGLVFWASLHTWNAYGQLGRSILYEDVPKRKPRPKNFVLACAVEMHMKVSEEAFYVGYYKENARPQD